MILFYILIIFILPLFVIILIVSRFIHNIFHRESRNQMQDTSFKQNVTPKREKIFDKTDGEYVSYEEIDENN